MVVKTVWASLAKWERVSAMIGGALILASAGMMVWQRGTALRVCTAHGRTPAGRLICVCAVSATYVPRQPRHLRKVISLQVTMRIIVSCVPLACHAGPLYLALAMHAVRCTQVDTHYVRPDEYQRFWAEERDRRWAEAVGRWGGGAATMLPCMHATHASCASMPRMGTRAETLHKQLQVSRGSTLPPHDMVLHGTLL